MSIPSYHILNSSRMEYSYCISAGKRAAAGGRVVVDGFARHIKTQTALSKVSFWPFSLRDTCTYNSGSDSGNQSVDNRQCHLAGGASVTAPVQMQPVDPAETD